MLDMNIEDVLRRINTSCDSSEGGAYIQISTQDELLELVNFLNEYRGTDYPVPPFNVTGKDKYFCIDDDEQGYVISHTVGPFACIPYLEFAECADAIKPIDALDVEDLI